MLGDGTTFRDQLIAALQDPEVVNILHNYSDFGDAPDSLHHQLGLRHEQGSYGDHTHDGKNSSPINQLTVGTSTVVWTGTLLGVPGTLIVGPQDAGTTRKIQFTDASAVDRADIVLVGAAGAWSSDALINDLVLRLQTAGKSYRFSDDPFGGIAFLTMDATNGVTIAKRSAGGGIQFPANSGNSPALTGPVTGQQIGFNESGGHFFSDSVAGDNAYRVAAGKTHRFGGSGASASTLQIGYNGDLSTSRVNVAGGTAGLNFADRGGTGTLWEWYSTSNIARLWAGGDKVTIDTAGNFTTNGVIQGAGVMVFAGATTTTVAPAAGGAGALPATPAGYMSVNINTTPRKLAYY